MQLLGTLKTLYILLPSRPVQSITIATSPGRIRSRCKYRVRNVGYKKQLRFDVMSRIICTLKVYTHRNVHIQGKHQCLSLSFNA